MRTEQMMIKKRRPRASAERGEFAQQAGTPYRNEATRRPHTLLKTMIKGSLVLYMMLQTEPERKDVARRTNVNMEAGKTPRA